MFKKVTQASPSSRFALSLALVTLLAPVATDMYLASMPEIAVDLNVSYASVQLTLTVFLMAQGLGQIFFGPITDRFGRRAPMMVGIVVFMLSSVMAALSGSIGILIGTRFIQGLAGALLLVVGFSSVRDVAHGTQAARLFAILLTIEGLAPIFAPAAGGYIDAYLGWRAVLMSSAVMALAALANSYLNLPETMPTAQRTPLAPKAILGTYRRIITDSRFLLPALGLSGAFFFLFAYISGGSYLYQDIYGLSPERFGVIFGGTGGAVMAGAIANGQLVKKYGVPKVAAAGILLIIAGTGIAMLSGLSVGLWGVIAGFVVAMFGLGITEPALVAMTMASQETNLGFTAALMGALHLSLSSLSTPLSGYLLPISKEYWFALLLVSATVTLGICLLAARAQTGGRAGEDALKSEASVKTA